jgi:hypothetical protein
MKNLLLMFATSHGLLEDNIDSIHIMPQSMFLKEAVKKREKGRVPASCRN